VLRDGGRFPGVDQKVDFVKRVLAGRGCCSCCGVLAVVQSRCIQIATVVFEKLLLLLMVEI